MWVSPSDPVKPWARFIWPGGPLKLSCRSPSSLAETSWERDGSRLSPAPRFQFLRDGLLILNASHSDVGQYRCLSTERSHSREFTSTVVEYKVGVGEGSDNGNPFLQAQRDGPSLAGLKVVTALLVVSLVALLAWNFYNGHLPLPWRCGRKTVGQTRPEEGLKAGAASEGASRAAAAEDKPLVLGQDNGPKNNNHTGGEAAEEEQSQAPRVDLPSLQFIDDESEI